MLPPKRNDMRVPPRRLAVAETINERVMGVTNAGKGPQVAVGNLGVHLDRLVDVAGAGGGLPAPGERRVEAHVGQDVERHGADHPPRAEGLAAARGDGHRAGGRVAHGGDGLAQRVAQVARGEGLGEEAHRKGRLAAPELVPDEVVDAAVVRVAAERPPVEELVQRGGFQGGAAAEQDKGLDAEALVGRQLVVDGGQAVGHRDAVVPLGLGVEQAAVRKGDDVAAVGAVYVDELGQA